MYHQFFVNDKSRMCRALGGHPESPDHKANVAEALKEGYREVTGAELDVFRADTAKAKEAGWNPWGRTSYAKFLEKRGGSI